MQSTQPPTKTKTTRSKNLTYVSQNSVSQTINISPLKPTIFQSPNRKCPASQCKNPSIVSKNSVSYGELQIILENVQVVKNKAQSSIKYFEMKNDAMKIEIDKLTEELNQCQLLNKTDQYKYNESQLKWQNTLLQSQRQIAELKSKNQQKQLYILTVVTANEKHLQKIVRLNEQLQTIRSRFQGLVLTITKGKPEKLDEMLDKWRKQCPEDIVELLKMRENSMKTVEAKELRIQDLEYLLSQYGQSEKQIELKSKELAKQSKRKAQQILELQSSNNELQRQNDAKSSQIHTLQKKHRQVIDLKNNEISQLAKQLQQTKDKVQQSYKCLQNTKNDYEQQIKQLQLVISSLRSEISNLKVQIKKQNTRQIYEQAIQQICNEEEEYKQIVNKFKYLENFKTEHQFNVQKIEFLCRLLENEK